MNPKPMSLPLPEPAAVPRPLPVGASLAGAPEGKRLAFVIATMVFGIADDVIACFLPPDKGWLVASILTAVLVLAILGFTAHYRDQFFARLFVFGLFAGFAELPADYYSVSVLKILVYPEQGPFILSSPLYMPFSYIVVMVQLGYLSYWLTGRWGLVWATVAITLLGGLNVPLYEFLARRAGFWHYQDCYLLFGAVPPMVIVTEAAFSLVLPLVVSWLPRVSWLWVAALGVLEGVWMLVVFYLGFRLTT